MRSSELQVFADSVKFHSFAADKPNGSMRVSIGRLLAEPGMLRFTRLRTRARATAWLVVGLLLLPAMPGSACGCCQSQMRSGCWGTHRTSCCDFGKPSCCSPKLEKDAQCCCSHHQLERNCSQGSFADQTDFVCNCGPSCSCRQPAPAPQPAVPLNWTEQVDESEVLQHSTSLVEVKEKDSLRRPATRSHTSLPQPSSLQRCAALARFML